MKNDEDTDEIQHEVPCRVHWYDVEEKDWKDCSKGTFRLTRDPATKKQRILTRNDMGKITLNCAFYPKMKFELNSKRRAVVFLAFVSVEKSSVDPTTNKQEVTSTTEPRQYMIKLKESDIPATMEKLKAAVDSL